MEQLAALASQIRATRAIRYFGQTVASHGGTVEVAGIADRASIGDRAVIETPTGPLWAEVVALHDQIATLLPEGAPDGVGIGQPVELYGPITVSPSEGWIGRIVDPSGRPLDGKPLVNAPHARSLSGTPPAATARKRLGPRLETGLAVFNTLLPLVRGQRIGLFAGSGVGKSTLMADLARHATADIVVIALIGERGRELRDFVENALGVDGMKRAVIIVATSDQPALVRRRCALTAMCVAEYFRDQGQHVLLMADSVTRFAEAHREIAVAGGEAPSLRGYPPSTSGQIMGLAERAGPGPEGVGDITAVFTVLVAGSDMEEPIADIMRGTLDGHIVLDRAIAERGRFPAINVLKSVSRSLPDAATEEENHLISAARRAMGSYAESELMIRSGLYNKGSDAELDRAIALWPGLDRFVSVGQGIGIDESFQRLAEVMSTAE